MATISTRPAEPFSLITGIRLDDYPGFQEHTCVMIAATMAEFHNILIRSLNSVYKNSGGVKSGTRDAADLLLYGQFLCDMIEVHHSWEETSYFPALEKFAGQRGILESNVEQHHAFEKGLQTLHEYCQIPTEQFSTQKLQGLIEDIAPALNKHLHEEPLSFYRLRHLDSSGLRTVYEEQKEIARAKGDIWRAMPIVLGCEDTTYHIEGLNYSVHQFPWFLPYLCHYVFSWRYRRVWRFNYSDFWGNPKKGHIE